MTITIDLPPEQEDKLQALARASGKDARSILIDLVRALPNISPRPAETTAPIRPDAKPSRKTTAEILAGWDAEGLPSVYGRDPADATEIARRLRKQAESRELLR